MTVSSRAARPPVPARLAAGRLGFALLVTACFGLLAGALTGAASRSAFVFGLYDVAAALALSVAVVALCHLLQLRPRLGLTALAVVAGLSWLGAHRLTDAALFRLDQAQSVENEAPLLTQEFAATGADTALDLVDFGLRAETGYDGVRGALLVQLRSGVVVARALGVDRVLPAPLWLVVLVLAAEAAFVSLVVRRALVHLRHEPACAACGRYLTRRSLGAVPEAELARLTQAWARGERPVPAAASRGVAVVYEDTCPAGHSLQSGFAAVRTRRHGLSRQTPGPVASLPPAVAPEAQAPPDAS